MTIGRYYYGCCLLPRPMWHWGYAEDWYDGPILCLGFWFGHFYRLERG